MWGSLIPGYRLFHIGSGERAWFRIGRIGDAPSLETVSKSMHELYLPPLAFRLAAFMLWKENAAIEPREFHGPVVQPSVGRVGIARRM